MYDFSNFYDYPNLTKEREIYLFNDLTKENRDEIICSHLKLVLKIVKRFQFLKENFYYDLIQDGILGLIESIDRFNISLGYRFSTFSQYYIKGKVRTYLRKMAFSHYVPENKKYELFKIYKSQKELNLNYDDCINNICKELHCSEQYAENLYIIMKTIMEPAECIDIDYIDHYKESISEEVDNKINIENINQLINNLPQEEREIIKLRYEKQKSWRQIGAYLNLSHEGVRKKHDKVINSLREHFKLDLVC
jgi:RNA polymerase sigma factor (sigma-70 family)